MSAPTSALAEEKPGVQQAEVRRGLLPLKPGTPTRPMPGWDVQVMGLDGKPAGPNTDGAIVIKLPLPPGALPTLWNDDERFVARTCRHSPATT